MLKMNNYFFLSRKGTFATLHGDVSAVTTLDDS